MQFSVQFTISYPEVFKNTWPELHWTFGFVQCIYTWQELHGTFGLVQHNSANWTPFQELNRPCFTLIVSASFDDLNFQHMLRCKIARMMIAKLNTIHSHWFYNPLHVQRELTQILYQNDQYPILYNLTIWTPFQDSTGLKSRTGRHIAWFLHMIHEDHHFLPRSIQKYMARMTLNIQICSMYLYMARITLNIWTCST